MMYNPIKRNFQVIEQEQHIKKTKYLRKMTQQRLKNIALYYPINSEIDITGLLKVKYKNFYLPRCINNELYFSKYIDDNSLVEGKFGIKEPQGEIVDPYIFDIIYIPALLANKKCYRLGYGKGFYDRFFAKNNINALKVIVVSSDFITDEFIEEAHDFRCDSLIYD